MKVPPKYKALWTAALGRCKAAGYDFQYYKKSLPPIDNPEIVYPEKFKREVAPDE